MIKCDDNVVTVAPIHLPAFCLVKLSAVRQPDWSATSTTLLATRLMERQSSEDLWKARRGEKFQSRVAADCCVLFFFPWRLAERLLVGVHAMFVWRSLSGSTWTSQRCTATWPVARLSCRAPSSPCRARTAASKSCTTKCRWEDAASTRRRGISHSVCCYCYCFLDQRLQFSSKVAVASWAGTHSSHCLILSVAFGFGLSCEYVNPLKWTVLLLLSGTMWQIREH